MGRASARVYFMYLYLGFILYMMYFLMIAQANYWVQFYNKQFVTLANAVYCISEFIAAMVSPICVRKFPSNLIAYSNIISSTFGLLILIPIRHIQNTALKYILTLIPPCLSGFTGSMLYCYLLATCSSLSPLYSQAVMLGLGTVGVLIQVVEDIISVSIGTNESNEDTAQLEKSLLINAWIYYGIGVFLVIMGIPVFILLKKAVINKRNERDSDQDMNLLEQMQTSENLLMEQAKKLDGIQKRNKRMLIINMGVASGVAWLTYILYYPLFILQIPKMNQNLSEVNYNLIKLTIFLSGDCIGRLFPVFFRCFQRINPWFLISLAYIKLPLCITLGLQVFPISKEPERQYIKSDALTYISCLVFPFLTTVCSTGIVTRFQGILDTDKEKEKATLIINMLLETGLMIGSIISICLIPIFQKNDT